MMKLKTRSLFLGAVLGSAAVVSMIYVVGFADNAPFYR
jgi:hypothetical protein